MNAQKKLENLYSELVADINKYDFAMHEFKTLDPLEEMPVATIQAVLEKLMETRNLIEAILVKAHKYNADKPDEKGYINLAKYSK